MIVDYLGVDPEDAIKEFEKTRGAHVRFEFPKKVYTAELLRVKQARCDDEKVGLHREYDMRVYMLYLVDIMIFVDKSATYVDVIYLRVLQGLRADP